MDFQLKKSNCPPMFSIASNVNISVIQRKETFRRRPYAASSDVDNRKHNVFHGTRRHGPSAKLNLTCRLCGQSYRDLYNFLHHMSSSHPDKLSCPACSYIAQKFSEYKFHVLAHCTTGRNELSCPYPNCGYTASDPKLVQSHMKIRHEVPPEIEIIPVAKKQVEGGDGKGMKGWATLDKMSVGSGSVANTTNKGTPEVEWIQDVRVEGDSRYRCTINNKGHNYPIKRSQSVRTHSSTIHNMELPSKKSRVSKEHLGLNNDCRNNTKAFVQSSSSMAFACMLCEFIGDSELSALEHARQHRTVVIS